MSIPSLLPDPGASLLDDRLAAAEQMVRDYCGWHIAPEVEQTIVLDGSGSRTLFVPSLKVLDITACKVLGQDVGVDSLEWSGDGYLRRDCGWPDRLRSVSLTIRHGFASAPGIAEIIREMASRSMSTTGGHVRETAGGVNVTHSMVAPGVAGGVVLMQHERDALDRYKITGRL